VGDLWGVQFCSVLSVLSASMPSSMDKQMWCAYVETSVYIVQGIHPTIQFSLSAAKPSCCSVAVCVPEHSGPPIDNSM
jgi:hypothetical protein